MTKLLFFTAGAKPTSQEAIDIAIFAAYPGLTVCVRNAAAAAAEDPENLEAADYVADSDAGASTLVAGYDDTGDYPVASVSAPPAPALLSTQKIITSGVEFAGNDKTGSYVNGWTPTIVAGVVSTMLAS